MNNFSLETLPNEALMEIVSKLSLEDVLELRKANTRFEMVCSDDYLINKLKLDLQK